MLLLNRVAGESRVLLTLSWPARILAHITITFFLPAMMLGTISPVIAKRALLTRTTAGRAIGSVYAWATAGSILGTFAAGYYLIMWMRASTVTLMAAAGLACVGLIYAAGTWYARATGQDAQAPPRAAMHGENTARRLHAWLPLIATVFAANACVMAMEVVAGRIVSQDFGQSLYGWTTVIAVVLAGITLGSSVGGRLADAFQPRRTLTVLFILSAAACLVITKSSGSLARSSLLMSYEWPVQIALHCVAVFFLPSLTMGAVTPVVAKAALGLGRGAGTTVGTVYAWSSVGSIVGTLVAGFFLVPTAGMTYTLCLVAATLTLLACAHGLRSKLAWAWAAIAAAVLLGAFTPLPGTRALGTALELRWGYPPGVVYKAESQYSCISVYQDAANPNLREMALDHLIHSKVDLDNPRNLRYEYEWIYEGVLDKRFPDARTVTAMVIGGGGYSFPHYLEVTRPGSYIEVAEIDPEVTEAAHAACGLPRDTSMHIHNMDARNRIADLVRAKQSGAQVPVFDCVFGDSINDYSVPYHLTTLEFTQEIGELLGPDGIYMLNLIDMIESGRFVGAVANTCRHVFPCVYTFTSRKKVAARDTYVVVSSWRPLDLDDLASLLQNKYSYEGSLIPADQLDALIARTGDVVLTDDFAPVENMLAPVVRLNAHDNLLRTAKSFLDAGDDDQAINRSQQLLDFGRDCAEAYEIIGVAMTRKGNLEDGIANLRKALEVDPDRASAHQHLGQALLEQAQNGANTLDEAKEEWRKAIKLDPSIEQDLQRDSGDTE
jgi:spermidine synthase